MKMLSLCSRPRKSARAYTVANINPDKGIYASYRASEVNQEYVVCLCLPTKNIKTVFHNEFSALAEMKRIKELYKPLRKKNQL